MGVAVVYGGGKTTFPDIPDISDMCIPIHIPIFRLFSTAAPAFCAGADGSVVVWMGMVYLYSVRPPRSMLCFF
jgi:hypothetical protein